MRCSYKVLVGKPEGTRQLGKPRSKWQVILRWLYRKWDGGAWNGLTWLRIRDR